MALAHHLLGDSILFTESTKSWKQRRQAMTPAFYKGKLQALVQIAKDSVLRTCDRFDTLCKDKGKADVDMIDEIQNLMTNVMLSCTIGANATNRKVEQYVNGKIE